MSKLLRFTELLANDEGEGLTIDTVGYYNTGTGEVIDGGTQLGGTVVLTDKGVVYTPPKLSAVDEVVDSFYYRVTDIYGAISTANVTIKLSSVVVANNDTLNTVLPCGVTRTFAKEDILGNDRGGSQLAITGVSQPENATVVLNANGSVTVTTPPCDVLKIDRNFVVPLRTVKSQLDANGEAATAGLYADPNNITVLKPGDYAIMSALRMGSSPTESGWFLLEDSPQARLFYRILDQAYIDRHRAAPYAGPNPQPYPYFTQVAPDRHSKPLVHVKTYSVPKYIAPNDVFLMTYANTHTTATQWNFNPPSFSEDYYRRVLIDGFGPSGVDGTDYNPPNQLIYTTRRSNEDNLNNRQANYDLNRYTLDIDEDTLGYYHGGGGTTSFSENGNLTNVSAVYAVAYALRSVPRSNTTLTGGFTYTATNQYGVSDTAQVTANLTPAIAQNVTRVRYSGMFISENGFVGMEAMQPGNIQMGVHFKSREDYSNVDPSFPSSYNDPIDPLPDRGWNVVAKTPPNVSAAGTMVQQLVVETGQNSINAFRTMAGLIAPASMTGLELYLDPGETWESVFVSCQTWAATIPAAEYPYVVPSVTIPDGCMCLYINTLRPATAQVKVSGGDAFVFHYSRRDFVNLSTFITHATQGPTRIEFMPGNSRETLDIGTFALILKKRKT